MENKFSNIKERILYVAEYYKVSKELFFEKIGMTYGNFKGSAKERPLNSDAIVKILSIYTEVDSDWLLTGNGEMLKKEQTDLEISEKSRNLLNRFSETAYSSKNLTNEVEKLSEINDRVVKENKLQAKVIEGLEFKVATLEKQLSEQKRSQKEEFLYPSVAEPEPKLTNKNK
jgi:hypothetical protein